MNFLQLDPPPLSESEAFAWLMRSAFGGDNSRLSPGAGEAACTLALQLDLAGRVVTKLGANLLVKAVGVAGAKGLVQQQLGVVARNRVLATGMAQVQQIADSLALPVAWVKHAALWTVGGIREGERDARDIDLVTDPLRAAELSDALVDAGFEVLGTAPQPHHLSGLRGPKNEIVEIHTALWGVSAGARDAARLASLTHEGLLVDVGGRMVPCRPLMAAHAIVHALAQHASAPGDYLQFRLLADLVDLTSGGDLVPEQVHRFASLAVTAETVACALRLAEFLRAGRDPRELPRQSAERKLLAHLTGAALDTRYRRALELGSIAASFGGSRRLRAEASGIDPSAHGVSGSIRTRATAGALAKLVRSSLSYLRLAKRRRQP